VSLASRALARPVTTISAVLGIVLLGAVSLGRMPVSLLPDVELPVLTIRTSYPGAAATEVSRFVAEPIEQAVAATPGLVDLRSVSRNAEVTTTLRFNWGTDMAATVLQVRERLDNARSQLPERAERPTLLTSDPGERPIAVLGLTSPGDLRSIALLLQILLLLVELALAVVEELLQRRLEPKAVFGLHHGALRVDDRDAHLLRARRQCDDEDQNRQEDLHDPEPCGESEHGAGSSVRPAGRQGERPVESHGRRLGALRAQTKIESSSVAASISAAAAVSSSRPTASS
jgi:hypothetical protein